MKSVFPGFYPPDEALLKELWAKAFFAPDANVLLNLYRYSAATRESVFTNLEKFKERLWLPHQAGLEFYRNRLNVIAAQVRAYDEVKGTVRKSENSLSSKSEHPFVPDAALKDFRAAVEKLCGVLDSEKESLAALNQKDTILERLEKLFEGKIGKPYSDEQLQEIYVEGAKRFESRVPPGFEDAADKKEPLRRYGDLVLWKQIIDRAIESKSSVLIITDEAKKDWWSTELKAPPCPRPELIHEFSSKANVPFFMYRTAGFLEDAKRFTASTVSEAVVKEVRDTSPISEALVSLERFLEWQDGKRELSPAVQAALLKEQERLVQKKAADFIGWLAHMTNSLDRFEKKESE